MAISVRGDEWAEKFDSWNHSVFSMNGHEGLQREVRKVELGRVGSWRGAEFIEKIHGLSVLSVGLSLRDGVSPQRELRQRIVECLKPISLVQLPSDREHAQMLREGSYN